MAEIGLGKWPTTNDKGLPVNHLSLIVSVILVLGGVALAQEFRPNYDEAKVPAYDLPDPLIMASGEKVADAAMWREKRRPEVLRLFETTTYGRTPAVELYVDNAIVSPNNVLEDLRNAVSQLPKSTECTAPEAPLDEQDTTSG